MCKAFYKNVGNICDDGDACTIATACDENHFCSGGTQLNCDDKNPCTTESCDVKNGCVYYDAIKKTNRRMFR